MTVGNTWKSFWRIHDRRMNFFRAFSSDTCYVVVTTVKEHLGNFRFKFRNRNGFKIDFRDNGMRNCEEITKREDRVATFCRFKSKRETWPTYEDFHPDFSSSISQRHRAFLPFDPDLNFLFSLIKEYDFFSCVFKETKEKKVCRM